MIEKQGDTSKEEGNDEDTSKKIGIQGTSEVEEEQVTIIATKYYNTFLYFYLKYYFLLYFILLNIA